MLLDELKTPFRWHTNIQNTAMKTAACKGYRFKLITPKDRLLPFMFRFPTPNALSLPKHWRIYNSDTGALELLIPDGTTAGFIDYYRYNDWDYLVYKGLDDLGIVIPSGFHYSEIEMEDGTKFYSEEFWVDCDADGNTISGDFSDDFNDDFANEFNQDGVLPGLKKYTKLIWWNKCDIGIMLYQSGYVNFLYLDTELVKGEPELLEEGTEDANKDFITKFAKLTDNISFKDYFPEYIVNALSGVNVHEYAFVTTKNNLYVGRAKRFQANFTYQNDCYAVLEAKFQMETTLLKSQCCGNNQIVNVYQCPTRISGLGYQTAANGDGTFSVTVYWGVDVGQGPFWVSCSQVSGGAPQETLATNMLLGNFAGGTQLTVEVKPKCDASNGRTMFGNVLTTTFAVG